MISFELRPPRSGEVPEVLEVHLDQEGLQSLLAQLKFLEEGRTEHVHLMSTEWGGTHLADVAQSTDGTPLKHVKILLR